MDNYVLVFLFCVCSFAIVETQKMETQYKHKLELSIGCFVKYLVYLDKIEAGYDTEANQSIANSCLDNAKQYYLDNLEATLKITGTKAHELWENDKREFTNQSLKPYQPDGEDGESYTRYFYPFYRELLGKWLNQLLQVRRENLEDLRKIQSLSYHEYKPKELSDMIGSNMDDAADIREQVIECVKQRCINVYNAVPTEEAERIATFYWMSMVEDEKDNFWNKQ